MIIQKFAKKISAVNEAVEAIMGRNLFFGDNNRPTFGEIPLQSVRKKPTAYW